MHAKHVLVLFLGLLTTRLPAGEEETIAGLIRKLGSSRFSERESAGKALESLGAKALPGLTKAQDSPNPEIRGRARILLRQIQTHLESAQVAGAFRFRAAPAKDKKTAGFQLEITSQPTIALQEIVSCRIDQAIDDQGQNLATSLHPQPSGAESRYLPIMVVAGKSKHLKEIRGTITARIQTNISLEIGDILKSAGKTVRGRGAEALRILDVQERQADGVVDIHLQFVNFQVDEGEGAPPAMRVRPGVVVLLGPEDILVNRLNLLDAKGAPFQRSSFTSKLLEGKQVHDMHLTYRPQPGQGEPARLVYFHQRSVQVEIPFAVRDISLPAP
jgi:hypothetical protein